MKPPSSSFLSRAIEKEKEQKQKSQTTQINTEKNPNCEYWYTPSFLKTKMIQSERDNKI